MSNVPDVNQCTMPGCEAPKADRTDRTGLCADHLEGLGGDAADDTDESADTDEERGDEADSGDANPGGDAVATASGRQFYPDALVARDWWVNWVLAYRHDDEERDGKPTKQPVAPYNDASRGAEPVSWNFDLPNDKHPSTSLETVRPWAGMKLGFDLPAPDRVVSDVVDTGIIIPRGQTQRDNNRRSVVLIDWDDVRDPETEEVHPVVAEALQECDGYAEVSQSGKGIHQFVFGEVPGSQRVFIRHIDDEPFIGGDLPAVEMYQSGRLCAMTGRHVAGSGEDVIEGQDLLDRLCWEYGTADNAAPGTPTDPFADERSDDSSIGGSDTPSHEEVADALDEAAAFDDDDPDEWQYPDEWSLRYAAIVRARGRSDELSGVPNWQINGYAAAAGYDDGLDKAEVIANLEDVCDDDDLQREVDQMWRKAKHGDHSPPSYTKLAKRGMLPERFKNSGDDSDTDGEEYRTDPRRVEATVDPRRAWEAAGRVTPDEPDEPLPVDRTDDGEAWLVDGERVDVVRAAAVAEGVAETASDPITDGYPEAYQLARDRYGAPLPAYYTTADAIAEFDAVLDVVGELTFWDFDTDALNSDVTERGDDVGGAAVRALNPAWRESESEASVLVYESGKVWDADTDTTLRPLRFVALDAGIINAPRDSWEDGQYSTAYRVARDEYGAPLPRWEPS